MNSWDTSDYAAHASFVSDLGRPLLSLIEVTPGLRVLDLGCGDGSLAVELKQLGANVLGVDSSPDMVASAVAAGIEAQLMDGQHLTFNGEFDTVFSNAALHWMTGNPQAVVSGVYRALKTGGTFVAEMGGKGNIAHIVNAFAQALHHAGLDPDIDRLWYFPSLDEYRKRLTDAGFTIQNMDLFERPTPLPTGVEPWLKLFGRPLLMRLPAADRDSAVKRIANVLEPYLHDPQGRWVADYVRLRFVATKPA